MCGDHSVEGIVYDPRMGSPPHVRGPLLIIFLCIINNGITPACAGTTMLSELLSPPLGDHPRMCGDHSRRPLKDMAKLGSPPHVRGPLILVLYSHVSGGITPACAGTTMLTIDILFR
mgnify:CR=1 FL=1